MLYYFAYCTWLNDPEIRRFWPDVKAITKGYAANHRLQFHAAADRKDRGWCHLNGVSDAVGVNALGVVFEHEPNQFNEDYDDFERFFLTVRGDDGKVYDCWTYRLINPGMAMRPPKSIRRVRGPRSRMTSSSPPTATMCVPRMASASAQGSCGSEV